MKSIFVAFTVPMLVNGVADQIAKAGAPLHHDQQQLAHRFLITTSMAAHEGRMTFVTGVTVSGR